MATGRVKRDALADEFRSFLDAESVLDSAEEVKPYECDGLTAYRRTPMIVVLPETVEQVQQGCVESSAAPDGIPRPGAVPNAGFAVRSTAACLADPPGRVAGSRSSNPHPAPARGRISTDDQVRYRS